MFRMDLIECQNIMEGNLWFVESLKRCRNMGLTIDKYHWEKFVDKYIHFGHHLYKLNKLVCNITFSFTEWVHNFLLK